MTSATVRWYSAQAICGQLSSDQTRLHNLRTINADGSLVASAEEHRPLLAAIIRHDEHAAERLMRQHLEHIRQDWSIPAG